MKRKISKPAIGAAFTAMLLLIINSKSASAGAAEGIEMCMKVIIPSLFPFFVVTVWLNSVLPSLKIPGLRLLARHLHIPCGGEGLLLLGMLGGYPVGAQAISDSYRRGSLSRKPATIMLGYCSNAGPAFIFGVTGVLFSSRLIPWILWCIHIVSAILTGLLLPRISEEVMDYIPSEEITLPQAMKRSISITSSVCGWIILFKTFLHILPSLQKESILAACITGLLELSAGFLQLTVITSPTLRFILCAAFLSFGGLCVLMQTASVAAPLGIGLYLYGKSMQSIISILLALPAAYLLFRESSLISIRLLLLIAFLVVILLFVRSCSIKKLWKLCPD